MDEQTATKSTPSPVAPAKGPLDLSDEIERAVAREPLDRVRCVRVFEDRYRCNWWAPGEDYPRGPQAEWASLAMHRVRKSRFITAHLAAGQLVMTEVSSESSTDE
jgi:hypothetical protein